MPLTLVPAFGAMRLTLASQCDASEGFGEGKTFERGQGD